jgi:hypothetical protein
MQRCWTTRGVVTGVVAALLTVGSLAASSIPAVATAVSDEAALRAAFANDGAVDLQNDITLTDCSGGGGALERSLDTPVTLDGHGFTITQTCTDNVILQGGTGLLTVQNVTITGGHANGSGGGIFAPGDVTVRNSTLSGNHANTVGGGMAVLGIATIESSTIAGNNASRGSAGVFAQLEAHLTNSTVSDNLGGGVGTSPSSDATVTVVNSTITGNRNADLGAGIYSGGSVTLVYATVVDNVAITAFSNIDAQQVSSFGTVVTGGGAPNNCLGASTVSLGYNFSDDASCSFNQPTDRQSAGSPGLGALAANGGPTLTRLPLVGSPLLDAIPAASCAPGVATDQRGVARPQAGSCDIGAVEVEAFPVPVPVPVPIRPAFTG